MKWTGVDNFRRLVFDGAFLDSLWRTGLFAFTTVTIELALGFLLAQTLVKSFPGAHRLPHDLCPAPGHGADRGGRHLASVDHSRLWPDPLFPRQMVWHRLPARHLCRSSLSHRHRDGCLALDALCHADAAGRADCHAQGAAGTGAGRRRQPLAGLPLPDHPDDDAHVAHHRLHPPDGCAPCSRRGLHVDQRRPRRQPRNLSAFTSTASSCPKRITATARRCPCWCSTSPSSSAGCSSLRWRRLENSESKRRP